MAPGSPRATAGGPDERAVGRRTGLLFDAHGRMVFAVCRAILRDNADAEDAAQAAFLSAHEALLDGIDVRDAGAWLATIARNECRGRLRARSADPLPLRVEDLADTVTPDHDLDRRATVARLRAAIGALPEKQREAVVLRDLYGLRYGEICLALGVSRPSVEALLFRARRTLRLRLRPVGGAALVVPLAVREGLARAVPWFGHSGIGPGASSAIGAGILGKLTGSVAVKLAAGAVVVGAAGTAAVGLERGNRAAPVPATPVHDGAGAAGSPALHEWTALKADAVSWRAGSRHETSADTSFATGLQSRMRPAGRSERDVGATRTAEPAPRTTPPIADGRATVPADTQRTRAVAETRPAEATARTPLLEPRATDPAASATTSTDPAGGATVAGTSDAVTTSDPLPRPDATEPPRTQETAISPMR